MLYFGRFAFHSARHLENKTSLLQQTSHNYMTSASCRLGQDQGGKASSEGEYSESKFNTHIQALLPAGRLTKITCGCTTTSFGHGSQCRTISKGKKSNGPHSLGEEQDSKLGNSLTVIGIFCIKACRRAQRHSAGNGADDYV